MSKRSEYEYQDIRKLTNQHNINHNKVWTQGRVHKIRSPGKNIFIVLRYQDQLVQAIGNKKNLGNELFKEMSKITPESIINIYGKLVNSPFEIKFTSYKNLEFQIENFEMVSEAAALPFSIDDANDHGESFRSIVGSEVRHDSRWLDLRIPVNNSIFKIQSQVCQLFRNYLLENDFIEIHTPKTIGAASESGAEVFELEYFGKKAYLAQSPQLYKQMAINSDFDRVFEIGPVFRAEKSFTSRHLCEFTGLDLEMTISPNSDYHEVLHMIWNTLVYIFDNLKVKCQKEIDIIKEKLPFDEVVYSKEPVIINFVDGVAMLNKHGLDEYGCESIQDPFKDLSTANERTLGELVKEKYGVDLFILDKYPSDVRPFYTMLCEDDPTYSKSYDIIFRCTEISSGAQRVNGYNMLLERVKEKGIDPDSIKHYIESFSHGSKPHGGCGFGLERIVSLYLDLGSVKKASFCYRDPDTLEP